MGERIIKLPDVGEGVAEAELVEWHVKVGDLVREDAILAAVMTDKATVEIPSPADGEITWLGGEVGDTIAVGSPIVRLAIAGDAATEGSDKPATMDDGQAEAPIAEGLAKEGENLPPPPAARTAPQSEKTAVAPKPAAWSSSTRSTGAPRPEGDKPLASPAVRLRARDAGIDLRQVAGTGPAGRITHEDLNRAFAAGPGSSSAAPALRQNLEVEEVKVVGLRRRISEKMSKAKARIPHITYVEELDVTALEELRASLNAQKKEGRPKLTLMPFLMRAIVKAVAEQPGINAIFDDEAGVVHRHGGVHIGIAAQTPAGLMVPVARHCEARDLWGCAVEAGRLAEVARNGSATREELSGSTITITSLGAMGGIATTPVINYPEVAIVGVNKIMMRPVWDGSQFIPRKMMNLSSSFDHRVVDGWDAAIFVQRLKTLIETPALIFVEG